MAAMTTPTEMMVAFLSASQGLLTPNLMKYTADLDGDKVLARIVVLNGIGEDELDYIYEILGNLVGDTGGTADFELLKVDTAEDAAKTPDRHWPLYRAHAVVLALKYGLSASDR
jgi:hypothetical protein